MADFNWQFPYRSQRMPVLASNMVATSQPLAAQAGVRILLQGGNAADAAVAAAIALTVVEPTANGIGSDAFCLIWAGGGLHGLNASGRSPAKMTAEHFAGRRTIGTRGWDPITVPGAVSSWVEVSRRFGSAPFEKLFEPAIHYAERGFPVSPQTAGSWRSAVRAYRDFEDWQQTFAPNGRGPRNGEVVTLPDHGRTLRLIAESKGEAFYRGELARQISAASDDAGGLLSFDDLANHKADWVRPISVDYRGYELHEIPPNGQGLAALLMLGILRQFDMENLPVDSPESLHVQIEAMKLAFADAHRYVADPEYMDVQIEALLAEPYLKSRADLIDLERAQDFDHGRPAAGGTVYLCAADSEGTMVSFIQSNYTGFGSGVVIPQTGIAMQNRGANFTLEDGHPNQVGPGKRPYHTIIPGFLTQSVPRGEARPLMAFGVMGGFMQPQGHAQVVIRMVDYSQNPQAALDAPRWQVDRGLRVSIEPGFDDDVYVKLENMGHEVRRARARTVSHGGGQAIYRMENAYFGGSDQRRDGQAVGY